MKSIPFSIQHYFIGGVALLSSFSAFPLTIHLNDIGGASPGTLAGDGFIAAAELWESVFTDPISVNLDVGFSSLGAGILGSTSSTSLVAPYSMIRDALNADQSSIYDQSAHAHLQTSDTLEFLTNDPQGNYIFDQDGSNNNFYLSVNKANLKALGLVGEDLSADGAVTFSSDFSFDFDPSDGIEPGFFDFVAVSVHEIGHALGFVSGVDSVDYFSGNGPGTGQIEDFNPFAIFTVLDLFRFSQDSLSLAPGILDLAFQDAGQYFSLDAGITNLAQFSTGRYNGDGQQASHWKDNLNLGLLDPTLSSGQLGIISELDLLALDVIGYDLNFEVPDDPTTEIEIPSTLLLFIAGLGLLRRQFCLHNNGSP